MNDQPQPQDQPPKERKDPLRDLVTSLTPDTSSKLKGFLLPPKTGLMFAIGPFVYKVSAINAGQLRFSAEFYGFKEQTGILRPGGHLEIGPPETEPTKNNPANITLDVHSGSIDGNAIFKPRIKDEQTPVE